MTLPEAWAAADRVVVLTGAGISTDSGIPDFRGPNGVWTRNPGAAAQFHIDSYLADAEVRRVAWENRRTHPALTARPNDGHRALASIERAGRLAGLVTQNIDGLHQAAGSGHVLEVHGTIWEVVCLACGRLTPSREELAREEPDPRCRRCGGILKSATVSFGQPLDPVVLDEAFALAQDCDLFVAVGTSLQVYPIAELCPVAVASGAGLAIVNAQPTPFDDEATFVIRDAISVTLVEVAERVALD